jgi:sugar lactone lactonase YvrE
MAGAGLKAQDSLRIVFEAAMSAKELGDNALYLEQILLANQLRPNHQVIEYYVGSAYALNNEELSASEFLRKSVVSKGDIDLGTTDFNLIKDSPNFKEVLAIQKDIMQEVNNSEKAFQIDDLDFHAEGIAYDPKGDRFFVGSVHKNKIIEINRASGEINVFATEQDGLWSVFGMKVDEQNQMLWVSTTASKYMIGFDSTLVGKAAIFKYDLDKGGVKKFELNDGVNHWFGDLTLDRLGNVYVSDSETNQIYTIAAGEEELSLFYTNESIRSLQGLALSDDNEALYFSDYTQGVYRLDLEGLDATLIDCELDISLKSIDGLYVSNNTLIATQNLVTPMRVSQLWLNESGDEIIGVKYLEKNNPILNEPTLGTIVNGYFYYVANSQWGAYNSDGTVKYDMLKPIQILRVPIN